MDIGKVGSRSARGCPEDCFPSPCSLHWQSGRLIMSAKVFGSSMEGVR